MMLAGISSSCWPAGRAFFRSLGGGSSVTAGPVPCAGCWLWVVWSPCAAPWPYTGIGDGLSLGASAVSPPRSDGCGLGSCAGDPGSRSRGSSGFPQGGSFCFSSATCHSSRQPNLAAYRRSRIRSPENLGSHHADQVHEHGVQHHRLGGGGAHADRPTAGGVAVIAADEDDDGCHRHAFDERI